MNETTRPVTLLIAAMGGEGGGLLTNWVVSAVAKGGYPVQATSIPGVAQRTGATTYYVEVYPVKRAELGGRDPVFSLYPGAGDVDLMVASELIEAARAIQNGYVTPERTALIASTHRVYAIAEKIAMGDGRYDSERVIEAANALARRPILADFDQIAREAGAPINAGLLGAIAGVGTLPVSAEDLADAIRAGGKAVEANLAAFEAGRAIVLGATKPLESEAADAPEIEIPVGLARRIDGDFPSAARPVLVEGVRRLVDYQGRGYAKHYLDRLSRLPNDEGSLMVTVGRHLAVRMAAEDVIRVAQLKTKRARFARARAEVGAGDDQPVVITEFLKPGLEEASALLPEFLARPLLNWARRRGLIDKLHIGLRVRSTTILGFLLLRSLARLRVLRPIGYSHTESQRWIEAWLSDVIAAAALDRDLAREIAECARLIKGYGETFNRGRGNYASIRDTLIVPALGGEMAPGAAAAAIAGARDAALAGSDGKALGAALGMAPERRAEAAE